MREFLASLALATAAFSTAWAADPAHNGIAHPDGWQNWAMIGASYRTDNNTIRSVIGNDVALRAAQTNPWPDGAILGKVVWREAEMPNWAAAKQAAAFVHPEFMIKDAQKYAATKGWGWSRWLGTDQRPYGANAEFAQECITGHPPAANRDLVFTTPAVLPK